MWPRADWYLFITAECHRLTYSHFRKLSHDNIKFHIDRCGLVAYQEISHSQSHVISNYANKLKVKHSMLHRRYTTAALRSYILQSTLNSDDALTFGPESFVFSLAQKYKH